MIRSILLISARSTAASVPVYPCQRHPVEASSGCPPAVSRHLRVLRRSGLIAGHGVDDDARLRLYELRQEPFTDLTAWLDQVQAFWADQRSAFREHVEHLTKGEAE
jgi:hypothetical protein